MGEVVQLSDRGVEPIKVWRDEPAIVLILPVVYVEREPDPTRPRRRSREAMERELEKHFGLPRGAAKIGPDDD
jgi:hypothetical protein